MVIEYVLCSTLTWLLSVFERLSTVNQPYSDFVILLFLLHWYMIIPDRIITINSKAIYNITWWVYGGSGKVNKTKNTNVEIVMFLQHVLYTMDFISFCTVELISLFFVKIFFVNVVLFSWVCLRARWHM